MYIKNKKGQSTVEYILLATAVIAVIIALVTSKGGFQQQLNVTLNNATSDMPAMGLKLPASHGD